MWVAKISMYTVCHQLDGLYITAALYVTHVLSELHARRFELARNPKMLKFLIEM